MTDQRWRSITTALQIITVVVALALLVYSVVESQNLAEQRADATAQAADRNRVLLQKLADQQDAIRRAQVAQRQAFRELARRMEVIHGNDPGEAPDFGVSQSSNPPANARGDPSPRREREPEREPDPRPRERDPEPPAEPDPPRPSPRPTPSVPAICVPLIEVCIGEE